MLSAELGIDLLQRRSVNNENESGAVVSKHHNIRRPPSASELAPEFKLYDQLRSAVQDVRLRRQQKEKKEESEKEFKQEYSEIDLKVQVEEIFASQLHYVEGFQEGGCQCSVL